MIKNKLRFQFKAGREKVFWLRRTMTNQLSLFKSFKRNVKSRLRGAVQQLRLDCCLSAAFFFESAVRDFVLCSRLVFLFWHLLRL